MVGTKINYCAHGTGILYNILTVYKSALTNDTAYIYINTTIKQSHIWHKFIQNSLRNIFDLF